MVTPIDAPGRAHTHAHQHTSTRVRSFVRGLTDRPIGAPRDRGRTQSGFSFMAASLREPWQPTLYTPTLSMNLPGWITYDDATGAMDEAQATAMVDVLLASLHRRALLVRSLRRS